MKKHLLLSSILLFTFVISSCKNEAKLSETNEVANQKIENTQDNTSISFGVRGNCGMCKESIEKAAKSITGVSSANWDKNKKKIDIVYNPTVLKAIEIHQAIAKIGYDTDKVSAHKNAYDNLPACCQYDQNMVMSQQ